MRINTNIAALNSYNQLKNTQGNLSKSLSRLSSGKRINGASDDAAGLAISEKMNSQVRGLGQAQRNAQDGISMIQTAEGALKESHSILQRMRELSVQSANDTNTAADRGEIQKEIDQLNSELDRIASDTEFNSKKLLNGSIGASATISTNNSGSVSSKVNDSSISSGSYNVDVSNVTTTADANLQAGGTGLSSGDITISGTDIKAGGYSLEFSGAVASADITLKDSDGNTIATASGVDTTDGTADTIGGFDIADSTYSGTAGTATFDTTISADVSITDPDGNVTNQTGISASLSDSTINTDGGFDITVDSDLVAGTDTYSVNNNSVGFQIGANQGQNTKVAMSDMSASALNVDNLDVTTKEGANASISSLDDAIASVSSERSKLGSVQNRLDHTINNLNTAQENLTAAESRISDVDMAKEMMEFTKSQILSQAGTAMMAQANQLPQGVLQLLG